MELPAAILGVWGAVSVLALVSSLVSLWIQFRTGSVREIESHVRQLDLDLHDLFDTVEKWTRRDRVRRLREGREDPAATGATPGTEAWRKEQKAMLRARIHPVV